jgi:hypothetical protein
MPPSPTEILQLACLLPPPPSEVDQKVLLLRPSDSREVGENSPIKSFMDRHSHGFFNAPYFPFDLCMVNPITYVTDILSRIYGPVAIPKPIT